MRTDAKISLVSVPLPHISVSSLLGFMKNVASPGDLISFRDGRGTDCPVLFGRVIGCVEAPPMPRSANCPMAEDDSTPEVKGYLCTVAVFHLPSLAIGERWVDPKDVIECIAAEQADAARSRMDWLLSQKFCEMSVELRRDCFLRAPWIGGRP